MFASPFDDQYTIDESLTLLCGSQSEMVVKFALMAEENARMSRVTCASRHVDTNSSVSRRPDSSLSQTGKSVEEVASVVPLTSISTSLIL